MSEIRFKNINGHDYPVIDMLPDGWKIDPRALTAPKGYSWANNGKSFFGGERKSAIIKVNHHA